MTHTVHIRQRLAPLKGNQWYRDKTIRTPETFCGAPVTAYDLMWRDKANPWVSNVTGIRYVPCAECVAKRGK